jgi:hypothetical protein
MVNTEVQNQLDSLSREVYTFTVKTFTTLTIWLRGDGKWNRTRYTPTSP